VLQGWQKSTLHSYNTAVRKFNKYKLSEGPLTYRLPLSPNDVYQFVAWAGRGEGDTEEEKITAKSLERYLFALKAWHTFHDAAYPYETETRVKLMLKASGKSDALTPPKKEKTPVLLQDLADLVWWLSSRGEEAEKKEYG
jgi:site-specific recombinase XerD